MEDQTSQNHEAVPPAPDGYVAREVIWPGTQERFNALFPAVIAPCDE